MAADSSKSHLVQESEEEVEVQADSAAGQSQLARPQQQRAAFRGGPLRKADGRFMSREEVCACRCAHVGQGVAILTSDMTYHLSADPAQQQLVIVVQAARYRARLAAGLEPDIEDGSAPLGDASAAAASSPAAPDAGAAADTADTANVAADVEVPAPEARDHMAAELAVEPAGVHEADGAAVHWRPPEEGGHMPARSASPCAAAAVLPAAAAGHSDSSLPSQPEATEQQAAEHTASAPATAADSECPELHVGKAELAAAAAAAASNGVTLGQLVAHLRREGGCCSACPALCSLHSSTVSGGLPIVPRVRSVCAAAEHCLHS